MKANFERVLARLDSWNLEDRETIERKKKRIQNLVKEITDLQNDINDLEERIKNNNLAIEKLKSDSDSP